MTSSDTDLEEQLKEAGNELLDPPSSVDELLNLLDKVENLLANVEQAPSESMKDALLPSMKALIANELLRHAEMDVKVSVASCITEMTRIAAPDAPYNDQQMKEIFQLTVAAFEKLSHVSGRCYTKAVSILDTVAKVRSCLVMLDLECDALVVEMFQNFLKVIRSNHPHAVFSAMETIMTLIIDESEEISLDLLSPLLASVKKENQNVSPISWKLGEKVITNCAVKLKNDLKEAVQSMGIALDDYSHIVTSICQSGSNPFKHEHVNGYVEHLADENKLGKMTDSYEPTRADPNEPCQLNKGLAPDTVSPTKVGQAVDGTFKSVMSNGTRNDDTFKSENSSKRLQHGHLTKRSKSIGARSNAEPGNIDSMKAAKSEIEPVSVPKKRGRKTPNTRQRKSHDRGFDDSPSENLDPKKATLSTLAKVTEPSGFLPKNNEITAGSPSPNHSLPDANHSRRGQPKRKGNMVTHPNSLSRSKGGSLNAPVEEKAPQSADPSLKKESEVTSNSDAKPRSRKIRITTKTNEKMTVAPGVVSEKESSFPCLPEEKPLQSSAMNVGTMNINDRLSIQTNIKKRKRDDATCEKDGTGASGGKMISKSETKLNNRDKSVLEETPKTKVRRKHTTAKEESSVKPDLGARLVGSRIKVLWPLDKTFYEGVVNFYDPLKKKHQVLYADGDEEILNLQKEQWDLVGDIALPGDQEIDLPEPDASTDVPQKRKTKAKSGPAKQEKSNSSSKRLSRSGDSASISKLGRTKSAGNSADNPKLDKPVTVYDLSRRDDDGSKDYGRQKSSVKLSIGRLKTGSSSKQSMPRTITLPKGFL
ncbi:sister chromatid cohesion protein PDS5 homolog C-like isoform X3 [Corylus avellana]|uniref:sister chromatid cohesion protein PDS5 homolog C-like isoform X3 n=1 Tax=Corylus avellana TaxID=13451 RepID=UPI00286A7354|nr:sister chromatid cohesion protein PDS5 homolog C-like isoform X3 [Corylus avellana]